MAPLTHPPGPDAPLREWLRPISATYGKTSLTPPEEGEAAFRPQEVANRILARAGVRIKRRADRHGLVAKIRRLVEAGRTDRQIAAELDIPEGSVGYYTRFYNLRPGG